MTSISVGDLRISLRCGAGRSGATDETAWRHDTGLTCITTVQSLPRQVVDLRIRSRVWLLTGAVSVGSLAPVGSFVRRVKTASGATAVQMVHKRGRTVLGIDHIGSAHDEDELALLLETARRRLHTDQQALEIDLSPPRPSDPGTPVVDATGSLILWKGVLRAVCRARLRCGRR